jgi:hypothetical protein
VEKSGDRLGLHAVFLNGGQTGGMDADSIQRPFTSLRFRQKRLRGACALPVAYGFVHGVVRGGRSDRLLIGVCV